MDRLRRLPSVMVATLAGLLSPLVLLYNIAWRPATVGLVPVLYVLGLYLVSMVPTLIGVFFGVAGLAGLPFHPAWIMGMLS